ncbi:MAG: TonB-dependent receptor [Fusobacterium sp.]|nr:TonB-dependent receptor [Fusobacterium sp.]
MRKVLFFLSVLVTVASYSEETIKLKDSVVKGNRKADYTLTPRQQKNTFVFTEKKIREGNYKNVEDVLRDAPGVTIQNTAFGPRVDMRGSGDKSLARVKVLVDGVSINPTEETMASLPINSIPIESIKKIEIIPGGGATLYGSGSVGGVVSITTNSNATKNNFFMDLAYGSYENRNFGFAGGYNVNKNLYVNYGFSYLNSEDYREHEEKENKIFLGGFDYKINDKNRFRLQTRYSKIKQDGSNQLKKEILDKNRKAPGLNMDLTTKDTSYTFDYEYRPTDEVTVAATVYNQNQKRDILSESIDDVKIIATFGGRTQTPNRNYANFYDVNSIMKAKFDEDKKGIKLKSKIEYADGKGEAILGYDYQKATNKRKANVKSNTLKWYHNDIFYDKIDKPKPMISNIEMELSKEEHALYGFNKYELSDKFDLTAGLRGEWTKYKGYRHNGENSGPFVDPYHKWTKTNERISNFAGEMGGLYKYSDTGRVFTRYEHGFVTPFANQLTNKIHDPKIPDPNGFFTPPVMNTASIYVPSNLKAEITDTVEVGFRDYVFDTLLSTSLFLTDTTDEITLISSGVTNPAVRRWKYRNIGKTRRMGLEFEAEKRFDKLSLNSSLTLLKTKVLKSDEDAKIYRGDKVPLVPDIKATFGIKYDISKRLSLLANYVYFSERETRELVEDKNDPDYGDKIIKHTIPAYGRLDIGALHRPDKYSTIKVGAKNVLNSKYNLRETSVEALPAPERNYYLEMNVKF